MSDTLSPQTWTADNGDGTFTNPLFYDEFSDPDLIRVGDDFYLTGTTMHTMPGLPVLHSKDLVNWNLLSYAFDRLNLGPEFRLEDGQEMYGQGIWAPCFRYHNGTFYIFTNINNHGTQMFRATNPAGLWTRTAMNCTLHDLSVLFEDDGKIYVIWGYGGIQFAEFNSELTDLVPNTQRTLIPPEAGLGEGVHFYKIDGKYYITSAWFLERMKMPCARADKIEGPYEVNPAISHDEDFGLAEGYRMWDTQSRPFNIIPQNTVDGARNALHQGGIVDTPKGEWWGFSMMDYNSVGRLTCLSPVTWQDGWPYFGLEGNLRRTPRTWLKPNTGHHSPPHAPFERSDDFNSTELQPLWQWNHLPDDSKWSLSERAGFLRLHSLPATDFWSARNTLTQRSIGPKSTVTTKLDASGLQIGDVAGLALLNLPYAWLGVRRETDGFVLEQFDQRTDATVRKTLSSEQIWLRASCDFLTEIGTFSYSLDGEKFEPFGAEFTMVYQTKTFQGVRYSLFNFNSTNAFGGVADFENFIVDEPHPHGLMQPVPFEQSIELSTFAGASLAIQGETKFTVLHRGLGRVALQSRSGFISVHTPESVNLTSGEPTDNETFQWMENVYGDLMLLSLSTHCYLRLNLNGAITANHPGPAPDRQDGSCFLWSIIED